MINIDGTFIALCTDNGIEVYNKETQELTYKIPKHLQSHKIAIYAFPIAGIAKDRYLLWRDRNILSLVDLTKKTMTPFSNIKYEWYTPFK